MSKKAKNKSKQNSKQNKNEVIAKTVEHVEK
jgi:hypothetical protein